MVVGRVQHHNHNLRHRHHCPPHNHHYYWNVFCNGGDADSDIFMTICASSTTRKNNNQCQFLSLRNVYSFCDEQKIRTAVRNRSNMPQSQNPKSGVKNHNNNKKICGWERCPIKMTPLKSCTKKSPQEISLYIYFPPTANLLVSLFSKGGQSISGEYWWLMVTW